MSFLLNFLKIRLRPKVSTLIMFQSKGLFCLSTCVFYCDTFNVQSLGNQTENMLLVFLLNLWENKIKELCLNVPTLRIFQRTRLPYIAGLLMLLLWCIPNVQIFNNFKQKIFLCHLVGFLRKHDQRIESESFNIKNVSK